MHPNRHLIVAAVRVPRVQWSGHATDFINSRESLPGHRVRTAAATLSRLPCP